MSVPGFFKAFDSRAQVAAQRTQLFGSKQQYHKRGNYQQFGNTNLTHTYLLNNQAPTWQPESQTQLTVI